MSTPAQRHKARHFAMQALYQWQLTGLEPQEIIKQFEADNDFSHVDIDYFKELLSQVARNAASLDETFEAYLQERSLAELDPITLALLRMASHELVHRIDVPFQVVISEAVTLAKKFGAADSHKFINAVLDQSAARLRAVEKQTR